MAVTQEQTGEEQLFSAQVRDAECNAAKSIIGSDRSPKAVFHIIDNARALAEVVIQDNRHPDAPPVMCKEGCNWCCHQTVCITAPEAFRIAGYLASMEDAAARDAIRDRLLALDAKTRRLPEKARVELHAPCAFLSDGRCAIYPVRPLVCAAFTSFNVEDCVHGYQVGFEAKGVRSDKARTLVYDAVREGFLRGLCESLPESDNAPLELSAAVVEALRSPQAATEWLAGGRVFERAHLVEE